jgi:DNA-binding NtrC family response regulator
MGCVLESEKTIWILEDDPSASFVYEMILGNKYKNIFVDSLAGLMNLMITSDQKPSLLIADLYVRDGNFLNLLRDPKLKDLRNYSGPLK